MIWLSATIAAVVVAAAVWWKVANPGPRPDAAEDDWPSDDQPL